MEISQIKITPEFTTDPMVDCCSRPTTEGGEKNALDWIDD